MESPSRGGAFDQPVDQRVEKFTESISFDTRLYRQDIAGSIAHARMLAKQNLLERDEGISIEKALSDIQQEIETGSFRWKMELEDVHMNIEQALIDRLGDVGRKLHTARSRNDQVSTDLRLWTREAIDRVCESLKELQKAFVNRCSKDFDVILPAFTHLQRAQPVLAPHVWLAYVEKFDRDIKRLQDCRERVNVCSLGTAAVAGTSLNIDREFVARELGFDSVAANSLDVSSDRDFVLESGFCLTSIALHMSGWAEEWIIWSTAEFGFLKLPHQFCTGSSIMPQKINPDVLELTRGKSARVVGNLQTLLTLVKSLPLAYNRDLQEDKPAFFDIFDTVESCLDLAIGIVQGATLEKQRIAERLNKGYLDATSLMEFLIRQGLPQRTAHHLVGSVVRRATELGVSLPELSLEEFQAIDPSLDSSVYDVIGAENAVQSLASFGSSAPDEVRRQMDLWRQRLEIE